ncbi:hypothetical protein BGZ74_001717 [Mortierella antarctica]|nr:hypothetical protein BGZ74_001717 [Mortierella antarctica]
MLAQRNTVLALLALLASLTLTVAWTNKNLQNWDKGWSHNIFGEPLDAKTACDGEPCTRYTLTKPVVPPINRSAKLCKASAIDEQAFMCNHVPENTTLVSNQEFENLFPTSGGGPKLPQAPQTNRTRQKRSRWTLDTGSGSFEMHVWKKTSYTYSIAAASGLSGRIAGMAAAIDAALRLWVDSCGSENESGYNDPFFDDWKYVPSASTASIWFYIAPDTVCNQPAALACAFFPHEYPARRTTVMINNALLSVKNMNGAILTMAHEIGHVLGLVHEERNDNRNIWVASDFDYESIMKPNFSRLKGITGSDCLAMQYYDKGFPQPTSCKVHPTKGKTCTKATVQTVTPKSNRLGSSQSYWEPKDGGHDELLKDTDDGTCLGGDISQYVIVTPIEKKSSAWKLGWFTLGLSLSQCTAVRAPSDPDFFYAMQSDGNFVGYNSKTGKAVSSTGSAGLGTKGDYNILFQEDGNFVIYDVMGKATWSSGTFFGADNTFRLYSAFWLFNDGHFFIQDSASITMWGTGTYYVYEKVSIELKGTGYCLDAGGSASGTGTMLYKCNGGANQKWTISTDGRIQNSQSELCLDNSAYGTNPGNPIIVYTCGDGSVNQKWQFLGDGTIANHAVHMCVDDSNNARFDGNKIQMWGCNAGVAQQWVVKP